MPRPPLSGPQLSVYEYCVKKCAADEEPTYLGIAEDCGLSGVSRAHKLVADLCDRDYLGINDGKITVRPRHAGNPLTVTFVFGHDCWEDRYEQLDGMLTIDVRLFDVDVKAHMYRIARFRFDERTDLGLCRGDAVLYRQVKGWLAIRRFTRPRWALVKFHGRYGVRQITVTQDDDGEYYIQLRRTKKHVDSFPAHNGEFGERFELIGVIEGVLAQSLSVRTRNLRDFLNATVKAPAPSVKKAVSPREYKQSKFNLQEHIQKVEKAFISDAFIEVKEWKAKERKR
jgi:hypothetical protein